MSEAGGERGVGERGVGERGVGERGAGPSGRWAWAEIDLAAIDHNVRHLRRAVAPAALWAVVKADGYGHGAVAVARTALSAGAQGLCVALTAEGVALRRAGIDAPILVLSEQPPGELEQLVAHRLTPTIYSAAGADALAVANAARAPIPVHIKIDTGMQRVGVAPSGLAGLLDVIARHADRLQVEGVFTHLACADEPRHPANVEQIERFVAALAALEGRGVSTPLRHAANSAGALAIPAARFDLVRVGIAMYGISPGAGVDALTTGLRPAMALKARIALVKRVVAGSAVSYGWRHRFDCDTTIATVPIGYADGVPRRLGTLPGRPGADVLIGGRRCPIVGVVTMDQLMVDLGGRSAEVGDEVVLIGRQGDESVGVGEWAERLGTIGYEIVCSISGRVARRVVDGVEP